MTNNQSTIERKLNPSALIARSGGITHSDQLVTFDGHQFNGTGEHIEKPLDSIPAYEAAVRSEYEIIQTDTTFDCAPNDLYICATRVAKMLHGGISRTKKMGAFHMPEERRIEIGYASKDKMMYETVPTDWFTLPGVDGTLAKVVIEYGVPKLYVRHPRLLAIKKMVDGYIDYVRDEIAEHSIYRGKVITPNFDFVWVDPITPDEIIYNEDVASVLGPYGLCPIMFPESIRALGIDEKFGLCLAGKPGTGKTLFMQLETYTAEQHGCTTIVVPPGGTIDDLEKAFKIGRMYQVEGKPAVILFEDIEKLGSDKHIRPRLLEALDGMAAKGQQLVFVTTTNFPEQLDDALIRPGRIDQLITMKLPDVGAFEKLVRLKLKDMLADDVDWGRAFPFFEGYTQAWVIKATEGVLLAACWRKQGDVVDLKVTTDDLVAAANAYRDQYNLQVAAELRPEKKPDVEEAFVRLFNESVEQPDVDYDTIRSMVDDVVEHRINGASIQLETETGKELNGNLNTN